MKNLLLTIVLAAAMVGCTANPADSEKRLYMWLDGEANFERLSSPDSIEYYVALLRETGFTDVVVDVKSIMGEVLYPSDIAPIMDSWNGTCRAADYDMLSIIESACRRHGMGCYASLNVFAGGHNFFDRGIIYSSHPEWQSTAWWHNELMPISQMKWNYNGMLNPADPEVREYQLSILEEFARRYPQIDGIVFDRVRYDDISSDFSQLSKQDFERYSGITADDFPNCIMQWSCDADGKWSWSRGTYFKEWVEYRAHVIKSFVEEAHTRLKAINPELELGDYTGAWYPTYYYVGVNWASTLYDPSTEFDWATPDYHLTGYADLLDLYMTGLYYTPITKREVDLHYPDIGQRMEAGMDAEAMNYWYCVEGAAELAAKITCGTVPVTGSIYVEQYNGDAKRFERAVVQAVKSCDGGMMLFDMCHICSRNWWPNLKRAIDKVK